ncbi:probable G-protein coupled receptor B0563.6 [Cherax quadricarinatus]|uniref:probable G-protein coupled receptor B0563.6 n=1 Tax=Cherax quadricarinatus TaxID=27406 RepID=UPI002378182D|nr:putative G-protein coupled receptor F59B2.13 [Cherax quadricarinatus]
MEDVDDIHWIVYRQVLPVLVSFGIVANVICVVVLSRPRLRSPRVNRYFLILAVSDLLVCVFYIPVITTITGCTFSSYGEAYYFSHFGWPLVGITQIIGTYTILWLSLDRFIAVWMYSLYPRIQQKPNVLRNRMGITILLCLSIHILYCIIAEVECSDEKDGKCIKWKIKTGYQNHFNEVWHIVYRSVFALFIRWVPACFLLVFNLGLIVGVVRGRINFPTTTQGSSRSGEKTLIITMISITASYILLVLPITIYITGYAEYREDRCTGRLSQEILRAVGNCLQIFEHSIHIFFLAGLNHGFRDEMKILFHMGKRNTEEVETLENGQLGVSHSQLGGLQVTSHREQQKSASAPPVLAFTNRQTIAESL